MHQLQNKWRNLAINKSWHIHSKVFDKFKKGIADRRMSVCKISLSGITLFITLFGNLVYSCYLNKWYL